MAKREPARESVVLLDEGNGARYAERAKDNERTGFTTREGWEHGLPQRPADKPARKRGGLLSARELDVLHWLALGKSGGEIGHILGISVCTVRMHIRNIIRKLDVSNIPHAVAHAFQTGILKGKR